LLFGQIWDLDTHAFHLLRHHNHHNFLNPRPVKGGVNQLSLDSRSLYSASAAGFIDLVFTFK
jgi:hypothetical protein